MEKSDKEIVIAFIGGAALIISAMITGFFSSAPTRMSIQATQTAEYAEKIRISPTFTFAPSQTETPTPILRDMKSPTVEPTVLVSNITQFPTLNPTPTPSPYGEVAFRKGELLLVLTALGLISGFVGIFTYLPNKSDFKRVTLISRILISLVLVAPFGLVWTSFFLLWPPSVPLSLVLFIALLTFSILLWFADTISSKLNLGFTILILISPVYITAFGFTDWEWKEAIKVATFIVGSEILYFVTLVAMERLQRKILS